MCVYIRTVRHICMYISVVRTVCFIQSDNSVTQFSKMCRRLPSKFITIVNKFYSTVFIQPSHKFTVLQSKYPVRTHILLTRRYSTQNPSEKVSQYYKKQYAEELNSLLKDPKYKALYDKYELEIQYTKYETNRVPKNLTAYNWLYLLRTTTRNERRSYIEFLWKLDMKHENEKEKKLLKMKEKAEKFNEDDIYGLNRITMFHRIRAQTMSDFYNGRLISAMLHEPIMVFDIGYEQYMTPKEISNCAKQLSYSFAINRLHDSPFNLYFCNANKDSIVMKRLHSIIPSLYDLEFPLNITSKCYLETFDRDKLVYLTPHTNTVLKNYDGNLIYIIGAMVDKKCSKPISYQKAKKQGIKMMKLPLSERLEWGSGSSKNLPLNQVLSIMLDLKHTKDWNVAMENVPKRKLQRARAYFQERRMLRNATMLQCFYRNETSNLADKE
ncbi:mitochondrial ribonuclease P protein 1 homolog [Bombus vosnesenskii]|uniref:RNA (guanine-9-)-methyltransferase domain-containing protein 1 n=1 Tax=Bombus vosnesenskii TaxID=207650 RepID=A0A6J3LFE2_9HYME|nr:mitochondrial ribonuclease P protein 1 homolog [Bombus vosnesenskii]